MNGRRPESHVNERDEDIEHMEHFHRVAKKQDDDSERIVVLLEKLHEEYKQHAERYDELFTNHRHDGRYRDIMYNNRRTRKEIMESIQGLTQQLQIIEEDRQWNLDRADDLLNHINGYSTSPAAFVGLGPYMDDEPNEQYGQQLTPQAVEHLSNQGHTYFPYNP